MEFYRSHAADTPYSRALKAKYDELIAQGRYPDDARWEAQQYARDAQRETTAEEAAAIVKSLGITYGAAPEPAPAPRSAETTTADDFDWDEALSQTNAKIKR